MLPKQTSTENLFHLHVVAGGRRKTNPLLPSYRGTLAGAA